MRSVLGLAVEISQLSLIFGDFVVIVRTETKIHTLKGVVCHHVFNAGT